jgi:hypothetical protein
MDAVLLQPPVFLVFLCGLYGAALVMAVWGHVRQEKLFKAKDAQLVKARQSVLEIEGLLSRGEAKIAQITKEKEGVSQELARSVKEWDVTFAEQQQLKAQITMLRQEAQNSAALLQEEIRQKQDLARRRIALEEEIVRLTKELNVAVTMHEGLKGQYNEMEEQFTQRLNRPADGE